MESGYLIWLAESCKPPQMKREWKRHRSIKNECSNLKLNLLRPVVVKMIELGLADGSLIDELMELTAQSLGHLEIQEHFNIVKEIGRGKYGKVLLVTHRFRGKAASWFTYRTGYVFLLAHRLHIIYFMHTKWKYFTLSSFFQIKALWFVVYSLSVGNVLIVSSSLSVFCTNHQNKVFVAV